MKHSISEVESIESLPSTFKGTYIQIKDKWMYTARISEIIDMLKYSYGIDEWDILDPRDVNNGEIEGWLIDEFRKYINKEQIDFLEVWEKIKKYFTFSLQETKLIETGKIEERLWAIFTAITNPNLDIKY